MNNNKDSFKRGPFGSSLTKAMFVEHGYKVYEQYCPINDDCSYARYYVTEIKFNEMKAFQVIDGDFLISCSGVSLGRITQVPKGSEKGIINQALLRVRINNLLYNDKFFKLLVKSPPFQKKKFENSTGSAIPNLKGVKQLKAMPVPLLSLEEQHEIIRQTEQLFAYADTIEKEVSSALTRVNNLTQSILAKAFRGELTAQWRIENPELISGENSAAALLDRIKTERAANSSKKTLHKKA
ncbi:restriction endonuclease subunit S [Sodalis sp. dw_96]|uniref:restriction endonuclease subunit S n=1 Tax=Sodalis sp. dw_96 TaxID=2719794 RepID=UPI001BD6DB39|nr:restriction endonuclease subunit S [Sodalis sp. dw_96]